MLVKVYNNDVVAAYRKLKKKLYEDRILVKLEEKRRYEKPSERRRRRHKEAVRRLQRDKEKLLKERGF